MTLSQRLRAANGGVWDEMQSHRFVRDIEADALSPAVFRRYLVHERAFVETAILIFAQALLKAPGLAARRWLCGVLHGLGGEQLSYFDRVFAALAVPPHRPGGALPAPVAAFDRGMLQVAETGGYLDILTVMLAAEWTYATWCSRAHRAPISDPAVADWVRLHAEPAFLAQADWLKSQIDAAAAQVDDAAFERLSGLFGHALRLEIGFHAAPYEAVPAAHGIRA